MERSPNVQLAWLSLAMFLGMTLWFSATAANAPIAAEFHLSAGETAWLTMAVQAGFVAGTLVSALLNLPDLLNPRRAVQSRLHHRRARQRRAGDGGWYGAADRAARRDGGRPRLGISAGDEDRRRLVPGAARRRAWRVDWCVDRRFGLSSPAGGGVGHRALESADAGGLRARGPGRSHRARSRRRRSVHVEKRHFDPAAVARAFSDRRTRLATLGCLGHMWELYALWTWIAAFAAAGFGFLGAATPSSPAGSAVAFVTIGSGAIGSVAAGAFADRIGKARIAAWAMIVSGICSASAGFLFHAPAPVLFAFAAVWGVAAVADSAQLG